MSKEKDVYFPPLYGEVECNKCEKEDCYCRGKYQRSKREFTVTSGRCPRLPDKCGFVDSKERELYAQTFPLVHAELGGEDALHLSLSMPNEKRIRKIYRYQSTGSWYFRCKDKDGNPIRRVLLIGSFSNEQSIIDFMVTHKKDYCIFTCEITQYWL